MARPPANDNFASPFLIRRQDPTISTGTTPAWSVAGLTMETDESEPSAIDVSATGVDQSAWFRFTPWKSGELTLDCFGSLAWDDFSYGASFDGLWLALAVYTGESLGTLVEQGAMDNVASNQLFVSVVVSTVYHIQVVNMLYDPPPSSGLRNNGLAKLNWSLE